MGNQKNKEEDKKEEKKDKKDVDKKRSSWYYKWAPSEESAWLGL